MPQKLTPNGYVCHDCSQRQPSALRAKRAGVYVRAVGLMLRRMAAERNDSTYKDMVYKTPGGSAVDAHGKVLFFSIDRFIRDIVKGDCCFICGVARSEVPFNDEHVIPDWILKRYALHSKQIGLNINQAGQMYGRFTVPCCESCNSLMADTFETPISRLVSDGYDALLEHLKSKGPMLYFQWLTLIFFKVHYRDRTLRLHLDRRKGDEMIGDFVDWGELHHIHCVARAFYTGARFDITALGSFALLPAKAPDLMGPFDYGDLSEAQTMLLRLGGTAFIAVLNDSCAAWNVFGNDLKKITGLPTGIQIREVMAHMAWINLRLEERPAFSTYFSAKDQSLTIRAEHPKEIKLRDAEPEEFGNIMHTVCRELIGTLPGLNEEVAAHIRAGRWSFLFRPDGSFIDNSV